VGDEIVLGRLTFLRNEVKYLKQERDAVPNFRHYEEHVRLRRAVERSLQVCVEACLDIGRRIIALESYRFPEDNKDVFQVLAEEGIVGGTLLPALVKMASFRNLVVHDYAKIDDAQVYAILKHNLGDFNGYARAIVGYLETS
jgi:uncharacterized protein YutE (UPF0331/DUF86 family)